MLPQKIFMRGYIIYVIALIISWLVVEPEDIFLPVITLTLIFGVFNIYIFLKTPNVKKQ